MYVYYLLMQEECYCYILKVLFIIMHHHRQIGYSVNYKVLSRSPCCLLTLTTKYLGHYITDFLSDDDDINRQRRTLFVQGKIILRKFNMCSLGVKLTLFRTYLYYCRRAILKIRRISSRAVAIRQRSWRRFFYAYILPIRYLCATAFCVLL